MGRLGLAFKVLFSGATAKKVMASLSEETANLPAPAATPKPKLKPATPQRSDAVMLLSVLQREARFVDFIKESIDGYNDAQVGAAVREIHRGCQTVLERMFGPVAIVDQEEGSSVDIEDAASGKFRLTGNVAQASGSISGELMHHGWQTTRCDVPKWSGDDDAVNVIAPAEVQVS